LIKDLTKHNTLPLLLSVIIGLFFAFRYIGLELDNAISVQDDFRQSFFWVWQYFDSSILQNDFFAEMYKSHIIRLPLLNFIFHMVARFNLDLILFSKYFAIVIGVASSLVSYLFISAISKSKILAGFFTLFISFVFYCTDHISAAQARSFIWLGLMLYMYLKNTNKNILASLTCLVLLLISPNTFLLCQGMEVFYWFLESVKQKKILFKSISFYSILLNTLITFILYKVIFRDIQTQGVGTPFSKFELKTLPEFNPGGRHPVFGSHFFDGTWFSNEHWGFGYGYLEISKLVFIGLAALAVYFTLRYLLKSNSDNLNAILLLALSSITLYFSSQLLFPLLYLPSRYIAAPTLLLSVVFIFLAIEKLTEFCFDHLSEVLKFSELQKKQFLSISFILIATSFCLYFFSNEKKYIHLRYVSMNKAIVPIFEATPSNALIAGFPILPDLNSASIITKRRVYVDYERSMAYTKQSLEEIRRRNRRAIEMTFASSKEDFLRIAREEGITHFLALLDLYSPQYLQQAQYIKPYDDFLKQTIYKSQGKFFLKDYLLEKNLRYVLLDISQI
jgi:hypothetical protein